MSKGYSSWSCWVKGCGKEMSAAGRYRHLMGHFNHGEITRDWIPDGRRDRPWDGYWNFRNWKKDEKARS